MTFYLVDERENAVNAWEWACVHSQCRDELTLGQMRGIVGHVFDLYGVSHPPLVEIAGPDHELWEHRDSVRAATTGRTITVLGPLSTTMLLHEVAHDLTDDPLDLLEKRRPAERECHGDLWLANYLDVLDRLMGPRFNKGRLMATLAGLPVAPKWHATVRGVPFLRA